MTPTPEVLTPENMEEVLSHLVHPEAKEYLGRAQDIESDAASVPDSDVTHALRITPKEERQDVWDAWARLNQAATREALARLLERR